MNNTNIYTITDYPELGLNFGKYKGKYPGQAAKKIFSKLASEQEFTHSNNKKAIIFSFRSIIENKEFKYVGTRIQLVNPVKITLKNGKILTFKYKNLVTRYKEYYNH
jgi:hypothetical protein